MVTKTKATPATKPATKPAKKGQAAKAKAPVVLTVPTAPKGYIAPNALITPAKQRAANMVPVTYTSTQGYPQGAQLVQVLKQQPGLTTQQQSYHAALVAAAGGIGKPVACNVLLAAIKHAHNARRVLRRGVRAGYIVWQPTTG